MTAEIAILNKGAVALAADSAVTIPHMEAPKVFDTVNKLFMLSKFHPVGIMVYGTGEFLEVPWETVIKEYRRRLGEKSFNSTEEYCRDFLGFLSPESNLFTTEAEDRHFANKIRFAYERIRGEIWTEAREALQTNEDADSALALQVAGKVIGRVGKVLAQASRLKCLEGISPKDAGRTQHDQILKLQQEVFEDLPLTPDLRAALETIAIELFTKQDSYLVSESGIVVTGFGEKEHYPSLVSVGLDGMFQRRVRQTAQDLVQVTEGTSAWIVPFAQKEMVQTFMEGVNPEYHKMVLGYLNRMFHDLPSMITDNLEGLPPSVRAQLAQGLATLFRTIWEKFNEHIDRYRREKLVEPITGAVTFLPKDELAAMAEALVHLTLFKRRVSMSAETVRGPIDVAVISKGDGFIWIKRKHYFKPEYNPGFFANYYRFCSPKTGG